MNTVTKAMHKDLVAVKNAKIAASKSYQITRLTKSGKPSKMSGDTYAFHTALEAMEFVERIQNLNPTTTFNWQYNEALQAELHN